MSSDQSKHIPPHNLEAEMAVIGSILVDRNMLDEVLGTLRADDFYNPKHEKIFASMLELAKADEPIDSITLTEKAHKLPTEERGALFAYLATTMDIVPCAEDVRSYAKIVREKSDLRAIIHAGSEIMKIGYRGEGNPERAVADADKAWKAACDSRNDTRGSLDLVAALRGNYDRVTDITYGQTVTAVQKTPWREVNESLGGFSPENLIVWAAAPKAGKSGAVLTLADYVAAHYGAVMYCSLEVPLPEMVMRYVAMYARISVRKQLEGNLSEQELGRVLDANAIISNRPMRFFGRESCKSLSDIRASMRELRRKEYVAAVVIDGLNFMRDVDPSGPRDHSSKNDRMDALYRELLSFASDNQVVVHVVTHINREGQKNLQPRAADIRDGGNPEGHAHAVIMPHRPHAVSDIEAEREEGSFVIAAARNGAQTTIPMSFKLGRGLWLDRDTLRPWFETTGVRESTEDLYAREAAGW